MPRGGVHFPLELAFIESDRQLLSNGITTAFHGITYSWEPGLRGRKNYSEAVDTLRSLNGALQADHRIHLRFETYNFDAADDIVERVEAGEVGILAFNDHTPSIFNERHNTRKIGAYADRPGLNPEIFVELVESVMERSGEVVPVVERLAAAARTAGVPQFSHDDETPEGRAYYDKLGCTVSEFPVNAKTIDAAVERGHVIVMGAPNVVRGGSHTGGISAAECVVDKKCHVLASDYYYPSALVSAFTLIHKHGLSLAEAWPLLSENPANTAGMMDRGVLAAGKRADILLVRETSGFPTVSMTFVEGKPVYQA